MNNRSALDETKVQKVATVLLEIERQLRLLGLWADTEPEPHKLQSSQPFCIDTLAFEEWLQFVFLPQMKVIIESSSGLPVQSQIAPMAEEVLKDASSVSLRKAIAQFDALINR